MNLKAALSSIFLATLILCATTFSHLTRGAEFVNEIEVEGQIVPLFQNQWVKVINKNLNEVEVVNLSYRDIKKARNSHCQILIDNSRYLISVCEPDVNDEALQIATSN